MRQSNKIINTFSMIIGTFLIIEGVWGLFSDVVFGVLTTNLVHAVIHIFLGVIGIVLGRKGSARGFCIFLGALLMVVGVMRFIPVTDQIVINILNVNAPVAYLNIVVGAIALTLSFIAGSELKS